MQLFWKITEAVNNAAVPIVAFGLVYALFISENFDPYLVTVYAVFLAFHFSQTNYTRIGGR